MYYKHLLQFLMLAPCAEINVKIDNHSVHNTCSTIFLGITLHEVAGNIMFMLPVRPPVKYPMPIKTTCTTVRNSFSYLF